MLDHLKRAIAEIIAVPPEPEAPFGAGDSLRTFRAAENYLTYKMLAWLPRQLAFVGGFVVLYLMSTDNMPGVFDRFRFLANFERVLSEQGGVFAVVDSVVLLFFILQLPLSLLLVVLDYEYRWYMITDRSLRIREGVWNIREQTMTFSNIQNVEIRRGPVQRLLGIADLEVRTAGGGSAVKETGQQSGEATNLHVGYFRGVDNATEVRELIMARLRKISGTGLGDPDSTLR